MMNSVGAAYQAIWQERSILLKVALLPLILKILLQSIAFFIDPDADILRQSLYRLPDFFVEGWLIIGFLNVLAHGDRRFLLPFSIGSSSPENQQVSGISRRQILAGILIYVITQLIVNGYNYGLFEFLPAIDESAAPAPATSIGPIQTFFFIGGVIFVIAMFRFLWLFIPVGTGTSMSGYILLTNGVAYNLKMIMTWIIGIIPISFIFVGLAGLLLQPYGGGGGDVNESLHTAPGLVQIEFITMQAIYEILLGLIQASLIYHIVFVRAKEQ